MNDEILYQIAITLIPGIGDISGKKLVDYCGSAKAVFKETRKTLLKINGIREVTVDSLCNSKDLLNCWPLPATEYLLKPC